MLLELRKLTENSIVGNPKLPVYSHHPTRLDTQEIVNALLDNELKDNMLCSVQPTNMENNVIAICG